MATCSTRILLRVHDRCTRRAREDEAGLAILGYALGAAFVVIPLTFAAIAFGTDMLGLAESGIDSVVP